ncbi:unnamed protein product [Ambrosiozyma monospora]|uniref:Unnamed protein product n=1 Tax=Ambrosiozyma monospora TaxID=43982 RepID=A0ACB5U682_AMBMO|nr:unnamed protein product [Ambrosiozyma monospora]
MMRKMKRIAPPAVPVHKTLPSDSSDADATPAATDDSADIVEGSTAVKKDSNDTEGESANGTPHCELKSKQPSHRFKHPFSPAVLPIDETSATPNKSSLPSPVDNYYAHFKKERSLQEIALKNHGITSIPESTSHEVLAPKGLLYSPSIAKQLKNLVKETKAGENGANWTTFTSREASVHHLASVDETSLDSRQSPAATPRVGLLKMVVLKMRMDSSLEMMRKMIVKVMISLVLRTLMMMI